MTKSRKLMLVLIVLAIPACGSTTTTNESSTTTASVKIVNGLAIESGADLIGADLSGASLVGADLSGANLIAANLAKANLRGANLLYANLTNANLFNADLLGVNLISANLSLNLCAAKLSNNQLASANLFGAYLWYFGDGHQYYGRPPITYEELRLGYQHWPKNLTGADQTDLDTWFWNQKIHFCDLYFKARTYSEPPSKNGFNSNDRSEEYYDDEYEEFYDDGDEEYYDDPCYGDCNDMDNDGRTWDDYDGDGDGLYESP